MNKKSKQSIILLTIIILPVLIFAFLKTFGENEFTQLSVMTPESRSDCPQISKTAYTVPDFDLRRSNGEGVSRKDLEGQIYVAAFIDTQCTSRACTQVGLSLYRVQERFRKDRAVKIMAHTANPQADSAAILNAYATRMEADPEQWYFVSGSEGELASLGQCGYGIVKADSLSPTSQVALIDGKGQIRGFYDASDREDVNRLLTEAALLKLHVEKGKEG